MKTLFDNAVQSIQLGVEDYQSNDPKRTLSAVRNFYAGALLLAKETLVRATPKADPRAIIGANYRPVPNNKGDVRYEQVGSRTIDFEEIGNRFNDFGLPINRTALRELNRIRNDIEHHSSTAPSTAVRDAMGKAFPVVADLFRLAKEDPSTVLGDAWPVMLDVKTLYDKELAECRATFDNVDWQSTAMTEAKPVCPQCGSELVEQKNPKNTEDQSADVHCRACGDDSTAQDLIVRTLKVHFEPEYYSAVKDGGVYPLHNCPDCGAEAYVTYDEENSCAYCGYSLKRHACRRCGETITIENVSFDNNGYCSYCDYKMSKDD